MKEEQKERENDIYCLIGNELNKQLLDDALIDDSCVARLLTWENERAKTAARDLIHVYGCDPKNTHFSKNKSQHSKFIAWTGAPLITRQLGILRSDQEEAVRTRKVKLARYERVEVRDVKEDDSGVYEFPMKREGIVSMTIHMPLSKMMTKLLPFAFESVTYDPSVKMLTAFDSFPFGCIVQLFCVKRWNESPNTTVKEMRELFSTLYSIALKDYKQMIAFDGRTQLGNRTLSNMEFELMKRPVQSSSPSSLMGLSIPVGESGEMASSTNSTQQQQQKQNATATTRAKTLAKRAQETAKNLARGAKKALENTAEAVVKGLEQANTFLTTLNNTAEAASVTISKTGEALNSVANATNKVLETAKTGADRVIQKSAEFQSNLSSFPKTQPKQQTTHANNEVGHSVVEMTKHREAPPITK